MTLLFFNDLICFFATPYLGLRKLHSKYIYSLFYSFMLAKQRLDFLDYRLDFLDHLEMDLPPDAFKAFVRGSIFDKTALCLGGKQDMF